MTQKPYNEYIQGLAEKWLDGTITAAEEKEFADWYNQFKDEEELTLDQSFAGSEAVLKQRIYEAVNKQLDAGTMHKVPFLTRGIYRAAAVAAIILITATYFVINKNSKPAATAEKNTTLVNIEPGGNRAVLTLANGSTILLDSTADGKIAMQGNRAVTKTADGQIVYSNADVAPTEILYNTLSTPRGGQYKLGLPDGTQVWLNSASSIKYPVAFSGSKRIVEVTGEAYFEVAKNAAMPFIVQSKRSTVEVLGTHFNINEYNDEPTAQTTLLEGSVKVEDPVLHLTKIIKPGQQAQVSGTAAIAVDSDVDVQKVMAWKNGFFEFDNSDLALVMRQLGRWYNVDIRVNNTTEEKFGGRISRNLPLAKILELLQSNNIKFRIEGHLLIVE